MTRRGARALRWLAVAAAAFLADGCRNPFSPSAVVAIQDILALGGAASNSSIFLIQALGTTASNEVNNVNDHLVIVDLRNYSSVDVYFTSFSVVYRDLYLNAPIDSLGGASGVRFPMQYTLSGFVSPSGSNNWNTGTVVLAPLTPAFFDYISTHLNMKIGGGADLDITLYGQDANGYDVRVTATLHVELY